MSNDYSKIKAKNNMDVGKNADLSSEGSDKATERPKLQSVVGSAPKKVQKSLFSRLVAGVVGPEGVSGIGGYVSEEIIKPAIKHIIVDAITSGINMIVYGDRGNPNRGGQRNYGNVYRPSTNYSSQRPQTYNDRNYPRDSRDGIDPRSNIVAKSARYGVEEYIIEDRHDAAHVLTTLTECASKYGTVSVADYYDLIKASSKFTDNSYGWNYDSIQTARIVPVRGGYVIHFPQIEVL